MSSFHEDFGREEKIEVGSPRGFGIVFGVVCGLVAAYALGLKGADWGLWFVALSALFFVAAFAFPKVLAPLNVAWFHFGMLLGSIITPLVMGLIFFVVVTPTGILKRFFSKGPDQWSADSQLESYWIERDPPGPEPQQLDRQF